MAYNVVHIQDWVISGPDGQPTRGHLITVVDHQTGDRFSVESVTTDPDSVKRLIAAELDKRRGALDLTLD